MPPGVEEDTRRVALAKNDRIEPRAARFTTPRRFGKLASRVA